MKLANSSIPTVSTTKKPENLVVEPKVFNVSTAKGILYISSYSLSILVGVGIQTLDGCFDHILGESFS